MQHRPVLRMIALHNARGRLPRENGAKVDGLTPKRVSHQDVCIFRLHLVHATQLLVQTLSEGRQVSWSVGEMFVMNSRIFKRQRPGRFFKDNRCSWLPSLSLLELYCDQRQNHILSTQAPAIKFARKQTKKKKKKKKKQLWEWRFGEFTRV